jgi:hypothetical protein
MSKTDNVRNGHVQNGHQAHLVSYPRDSQCRAAKVERLFATVL